MSNGGKIPVTVMAGAAVANAWLGTALMAISLYKAARDAWKSAHPGELGEWKSDAELTDLLEGDSQALVDHADEVIFRHRPPQ